MRYITRLKRQYFKRFRVSVETNGFSVKGPLGEAFHPFPASTAPFFSSPNRSNKTSFFSSSPFFIRWLPQAQRSVSVGYCLEFTLNAVSFKGEYLDYARALSLDLGYSHLICFLLPPHARAFFEKRRMVLLSSDFEWITNACNRIKSLRWPDAYKAKGVKLKSEQLKNKPGKQRQ
jgi:large subunit ribosomal protein L6